MNVLSSLLNFIGTDMFGDYVTEQGTSGVWRYRKWKSGIKECWAAPSTGSSYTMEANGALYTSSYIEQSLPSGLFSEIPTVQVSIRTGGGMWAKVTGSTTNTKIVYQIVRTNATVADMGLCFYCIGR